MHTITVYRYLSGWPLQVMKQRQAEQGGWECHITALKVAGQLGKHTLVLQEQWTGSANPVKNF
jgi:hypothetical protein